MKLNRLWLSALALAALIGHVPVAASAQGGLWSTLPTPPLPLSGKEVVACDTELGQGANPQTGGCTTAEIAAYAFSSNNGLGNYLIGGDATTNLWQRATTGASETTTYAYGGPDRWAYWSGASTAVTVSRDSTAADLPASTQYAFKMQRTAAQTGVVQICMAQEIETANSYGLAGRTVELDFDAATGANFSPAAPYNMTAYVVTGTGSDEGMQKLAWGLNGGGGGSTAWAGQANATAAVISLGGVSTLARYAAVANIPLTATEVGVALCYTPVGTAGTNDYIAFSNIQLVRASQNASYASATAGYSTASGFTATAFQRRFANIEWGLQYRYFALIAEPAASKPLANGSYLSTTTCNVQMPLVFPMRATPAVTIGGTAESNTTWAVMVGSTTPVVLASTYLVQDPTIGNTSTMVALQATTASKTAANGCALVGAGGGANIQLNAEL